MKITRSALLHLRLPFSFFLLPLFLFALTEAVSIQIINSIVAFIVLHFFTYPASNGFNSYFDKDVQSIALLRHPPQVDKDLYYLALFLDIAGILLALLAGPFFAGGILIYALISRMYSHPSVRLKRFPWISLFTVMVFQGGFIYLLSLLAIDPSASWFDPGHLSEALFCIFLTGATYPLTQIYQHAEDAQRGDRTVSLILGLKKTFLLSGFFFICAILVYYTLLDPAAFRMSFILFLLPSVFFFLYWYMLVRKDKSKADFQHCMMLNLISAICLNAFFLILISKFSSL